MAIFEINSCNFGSTGNIMDDIADLASEKNFHICTCIPCSNNNKKKIRENQILIGNRLTRNVHIVLNKFTGLNGCFSFSSTLKYLRTIDRLHPELIHLHNLHNCYINIPLLFSYIKKHDIPVIWTLHDCWAFTGQCPYFDLVKCNKWKNGCYGCPSYREYPESYIDQTKLMWRLKRKWFSNVKNLTIVTPSQWLANLAHQSFLCNYPIQVINNGINLDVFKPTPSNFRKDHNILDNQILLIGVSFSWGERKGLDVFIKLAKKLDPYKFKIVLVGTNESVDSFLPTNVISIHRTHNQEELAKIYTAADLFVNPTREDNYPTVNMESIACGTPVITFKTGGSPESVDESCGRIVDVDDVDGILNYINSQYYFNNAKIRDDCIKKAKDFDKEKKYDEYVCLYGNITGETMNEGIIKK